MYIWHYWFMIYTSMHFWIKSEIYECGYIWFNRIKQKCVFVIGLVPSVLLSDYDNTRVVLIVCFCLLHKWDYFVFNGFSVYFWICFVFSIHFINWSRCLCLYKLTTLFFIYAMDFVMSLIIYSERFICPCNICCLIHLNVLNNSSLTSSRSVQTFCIPLKKKSSICELILTILQAMFVTK